MILFFKCAKEPDKNEKLGRTPTYIDIGNLTKL